MGRVIFFLILVCYTFKLSGLNIDSTLSIAFHADVYYGYDFNNPTSNKRLGFLYNHNRHNEFNLNLALLSIKYQDKRVRSNFALQAGTYAIDNYADEKSAWRNIYEANVGIAIDKNKKLWFDAGLLPSYLGAETAISSKNLTLSRSLCAENSPYYLTGAQLTYQANKKWLFRVNVNNGWQRISKRSKLDLPAIGFQAQYENNNVLINYGNYIGTEQYPFHKRTRFFNNFYIQGQHKKLKYLVGTDVGIEQYQGSFYHYFYPWCTPYGVLSYQVGDNQRIAMRVEQYSDINNVIISTPKNKSFNVFGFSLNYDKQFDKKVLLRLEAKYYNATNPIFFEGNNSLSNQNFSLLASMAFTLD